MFLHIFLPYIQNSSGFILIIIPFVLYGPSYIFFSFTFIIVWLSKKFNIIFAYKLYLFIIVNNLNKNNNNMDKFKKLLWYDWYIRYWKKRD